MSDTKQAQLDELAQQIINDQVCKELAAGATQLVFGDGDTDADIVFIGEAPGKNEDIKGKPFVGASGKFLDEMLASIGMSRQDVYITNIVKYRPPANRDPLPEEKSAFLEYLQKQLGIIQPKLVVTLGRHSTSCFLPDPQISKIHGQPTHIDRDLGADQRPPVEYQNAVILPLYHPAAALYNGGMRQTLIDDFATIPIILRKLNKSK